MRDRFPAVALFCASPGAGLPAEPVSLPWLEALSFGPLCFEAIGIEHDRPRAEDLCRRHAARWAHDSIDGLLAEPQCDLLVIHAPPARRAAIARQALAAQRHVLFTAAPTFSRVELRRLLSAGLRAQRRLLWAVPQLWSPALLKGRQLLDSGRIGRPVSLLLQMTMPRQIRLDPNAPPDAQTDPASIGPGDLLCDLLADALDQAVALADVPLEVLARSSPHGCMAALLTTADACLCTILLQEAGTPEVSTALLEVRGQDGAMVRIENQTRLIARAGASILAQHTPEWMTLATPRVELGLAGLVAEATAAVRPRREDPGVLGIARFETVLAVLDACLKSMATGRAVHLKQM